jgi:hypothetical protein
MQSGSSTRLISSRRINNAKKEGELAEMKKGFVELTQAANLPNTSMATQGKIQRGKT